MSGPSIQAFAQKSRLFALIIGINEYKSSFRGLRGAEADARAFEEYLKNILGVPSTQIACLFNKDATRVNIIGAFTDLENDSRIEKGDAIVIFFAGHGSEIPPVEYPGWEAGGEGSNIQMIVPYDYSDIKGQEVGGLPDRIIGSLIERIAEKKGNNITAIFDCCNSASGTRGLKDNDSSTLVRSIELAPQSYNPGHDEKIWDRGTRGGKRAENQFRHAALESHMLIAACGASEQAKESQGRGEFSTALLKLLTNHPPDRLRYCDILTQMDAIPSQNPQCEGINQNRILFDAKVVPPSRALFPVKFVDSDTGFVLEAGSAQGITNGAEFAVYPAGDTELKNRLVCATADFVTAFMSTLILSSQGFTMDRPCVAVQTKAGKKEDFRLYIPSGDGFNEIYKLVHENRANDRYDLHNITTVSAPHTAHLQATMENNQVIFKLLDERVTKYNFSRRFTPVDASDLDRVAWVLNRAAHFYRELNRANSDAKVTSQIQVEFYALEESSTEADEIKYGDFAPLQPNLCQNQIIDFVVDEDTPYGLKLTNMTKHDFYPYLFYFDNSDLSITSYYVTPEATRYRGDIPLKKKTGSLTLGYGAGGVGPFSYTLREGQDVDIGFLKLFVSTKPIDLSHIEQPSPFEENRATSKFIPKSKGTWDTVLIPIIQRR